MRGDAEDGRREARARKVGRGREVRNARRWSQGYPRPRALSRSPRLATSPVPGGVEGGGTARGAKAPGLAALSAPAEIARRGRWQGAGDRVLHPSRNGRGRALRRGGGPAGPRIGGVACAAPGRSVSFNPV